MDAYLDEGVDSIRHQTTVAAPDLVVRIAGLVEEEGRRRDSVLSELNVLVCAPREMGELEFTGWEWPLGQ